MKFLCIRGKVTLSLLQQVTLLKCVLNAEYTEVSYVVQQHTEKSNTSVKQRGPGNESRV